MGVTTFLDVLRNLEFTAPRFPKIYPRVLLVKVGRRQSGDLGNEVRWLEVGYWSIQQRKEDEHLGWISIFIEFLFGGMHYEEILLTWGGLLLGWNFEVGVGWAAWETGCETWIWIPTRHFYVHIKYHFVRKRINTESIRKIKLLILFREIIHIYWEKYIQHESTCILQSALVPFCCSWLYICIIIAGLQVVNKGDQYLVLLCISSTFCCVEEIRHAGMILVSTRIYALAVKEGKVVTVLALGNAGGVEV